MNSTSTELPLRGQLRIDPLTLVRSIRAPTPLEPANRLVPGREIWLKREDTGPNGSFKWRGALCACAAIKAGGARAVVTSSTGNHGAATAWAAQRLGLEAHVVVPVGGAQTKLSLISAAGAIVHEFGSDLDEAARHARALADARDARLLVDGGCEAQLYGTGTIGAELGELQYDAVAVPLACGALAGGLARELASRANKPWVVGVQSASFSRLGALLRGEADPLVPSGATLADGLADNRVVDPAFSTCRSYVDEVLSVDDAALRAAMRELWTSHGIVVEGAGAAALAALQCHPDRIPGDRVVLIVSGRNIDRAVWEEIVRGDAPPTA